ncbi:MAG: polysaccharide biosynthesis C-terminal domain-containing protein [Phycisphaerales bacterium]|nr:MAG: polysaccharide biosynthesis C-terminal domain-containing protein [Phycisphaerales bacterium]
MPSYACDARAIFLASAASALAGLAIQACLAWFLLPAGRGEYAVCILFASLLTLTCTIGQEVANVYSLASKRLDVSHALSQSLLVGLATSVVACGIGYSLTHTSLPFLDKAPIRLFRLSLLCIPATAFHMYLTRIFLGMRTIRTFTLLMAAPRFVAFAGLLTASVVGLSVGTAIMIHAASQGSVVIIALSLLVIRHAARLVRVEWAKLRESLSYGLRFYVGKLASMTNVQIGTIILAVSSVDPASLGMFAAVSALASRLWLVAESLQTAILPRACADPDGQREAIAQCVRLCLVCSAVVALVVGLLARPIIGLVLSPRFLPVLIPFQLLLPGVVVRAIPKILTAYFNGIGRPGVTSAAIGLAVAANIGLMYVLLPRWGLSGVAAAMTSAYTFEALIMLLAFCRLSGTPLRRALLLRAADLGAITEVISRRLTRASRTPRSAGR